MKALEAVVLFKIDSENGEGVELAEEFAVKGYPNFVVANTAVETMDRWAGYEKGRFLENLKDALSDPTTIEQKRARFAASPTSRDGGKLGRYHGTRGEYKRAVEYYRKAHDLGADDYSFQIFENIATGARSKDFSVDEAKKAADAALANPSIEPALVIEVYDVMAWLGRQTESPRLGIPYLAGALAAAKSGTDDGMKAKRRSLEIEHALYVENDKAKALELKRASMSEGWKDDASKLNGFAWWCFENEVNLEEAEALARQGAELAPAGTERGQVLDTVAEICNARGNRPEAVKFIRQAIENDPNSEHYKKQLERFQASSERSD
jgi:tetratricopeptide (TPR) repeat protein